MIEEISLKVLSDNLNLIFVLKWLEELMWSSWSQLLSLFSEQSRWLSCLLSRDRSFDNILLKMIGSFRRWLLMSWVNTMESRAVKLWYQFSMLSSMWLNQSSISKDQDTLSSLERIALLCWLSGRQRTDLPIFTIHFITIRNFRRSKSKESGICMRGHMSRNIRK